MSDTRHPSESEKRRHGGVDCSSESQATRSLEPSEGGDLAGAERIGPYRILSRLGEGGFGVVYLAEQTKPVIRRVALKVIKPGMDSKAVIARFEQERQALAVMDHPNVARVLDAGTTDRGLPYFAMEYVKGEPITDYCDRHNLTIKQRLELFIPVCEAVQHAHMKGLIHRDIKPSNVLVSVGDSGPIVKVIDFGVAKALSHTLTQQTIFTEHGQLIGTPEYMSPEQSEMGATDIDTRTDVYSLGVLLYELLTGATPFDAQTLRAGGYAEIQRMIREVDPPKPSTRFSSLGEQSVEVAKHRQAKRDELAHELARELDYIPLKAMRKDRTDRYRNATELSDDIQRYLNGDALEAGPESTTYRVRKFIKRNRGPVVAVTVVMLVLIGGIIGTTWGMQRAFEAERTALAAEAEAELRAEDLEKVAEFQESQLSKIDTAMMGINLRQGMIEKRRRFLEGRGMDEDQIVEALTELESSLTGINFTNVALEALDENIFERAMIAIDEQFADQPEIKARLLQTVANTLRELGLLDRAVEPQTQALAIRRRVLGDEHLDTFDSIYQTGNLFLFQGKPVTAEPYVREAIDGRTRLLGRMHPDTLTAINNLGRLYVLYGDNSAALETYRYALDGFRKVVGGKHQRTAGVLGNIGTLLTSQGELDAAEPYLREALDVVSATLGEDHRWTMSLHNNLGRLLAETRRYDEAKLHFSRALEVRRRVLGDEHPDTLSSMSNLGGLLRQIGELNQAERLGAEAVETAKRILPAGHWHIGAFLAEYARTLAAMERFEEAESSTLEAHAILESALHAEHHHTIRVIEHLAGLYDQLHKSDPHGGYDEKAETWRAKLAAIEAEQGNRSPKSNGE